jgi:hypothetical protein
VVFIEINKFREYKLITVGMYKPRRCKMQRKLVFYVMLVLFFNGIAILDGNVSDVQGAENPEIVYKDGLLSVDAEKVKVEPLFLELGKQCNIDIIAHGDVFPEKDITINFEGLSIKEAIKRLVRACNLKNYLMDFKKDSSGQSRLAKIDLYMGGGGQRVLTRAKDVPSEKTATKTRQPDRKKPGQDKPRKPDKMPKSSFNKESGFEWDGSAPIDFPEYKGELAYDKSKYQWDEGAKEFSDRSMDLIPPAVRDMVSDMVIKKSDEVAQEQGSDTITSEIFNEAFHRLAKEANMPPNVMKVIPKTKEDLEKPRVPIDSKHLNEEFR